MNLYRFSANWLHNVTLLILTQADSATIFLAVLLKVFKIIFTFCTQSLHWHLRPSA